MVLISIQSNRLLLNWRELSNATNSWLFGLDSWIGPRIRLLMSHGMAHDARPWRIQRRGTVLDLRCNVVHSQRHSQNDLRQQVVI